jgi:starch synthase
VAQAGGLGEVVFGLSRELERRGHRVDIILPKYDCMRYDQIYGLTTDYQDLWVPWFDRLVHCTVWSGFVHGRRCFFIDPHSPERFFERGHVYGSSDDVMRFAFLSKAAMEYLLKTDRRPDVIHCHDWQTALVPVLLYEIYQHIGMHDQRVCYTIHNFAHQGITGERVLRATGLNKPAHFLSPDRLRDNFKHTALNLMKGGIVYSNFVTTVSPQHASEAMHTDQAMGLQHTLQVHHEKFGGVLNGIDYDVWNPEIDRLLPAHYTPETVERKYACKEALRDRLWLRKDFKPIVAYVGRLDRQKGVQLIQHAISYALGRETQVVLLGQSPDPAVNAQFWQLKRALNDYPNCHLELGWDEGLAHLIYAGADMFVMPSMFEPCGLTQMIGLKYGTVPVVRAVGGLVDTVFDRDYSDRPNADRNGYVFHSHDNAALESALNRAIGLWYAYPAEFRALMVNGMRQDHSWADPGQHYLNIYEYIAAHKPAAPTVDTSAEREALSECVDAQPEHPDAPSESADTSPDYVDALREYIGAPSEHFDAPPEYVDELLERADALPEHVDSLLEQVDTLPERIDTLQPEKVDSLPEKVDSLSERIDTLLPEKTGTLPPEKVDSLSERIDTLPPEKVDSLPERIATLPPEKIDTLPERIDTLPPEKVDSLPERIDTLQPEKVDSLLEQVETPPEKVGTLPEHGNTVHEKVDTVRQDVDLRESVDTAVENVKPERVDAKKRR